MKLYLRLIATLFLVSVAFFTGCTHSEIQLPKAQKQYNFSLFPDLGYAGVDSIYYAADTTLPANAIVEWNFGDGATSSAISPAHIYSVPGTYSATLKVNGVLSLPVSVNILSPLSSPYIHLMTGTRIWQRVEHLEPGYTHYFTDTITINNSDPGVIQFSYGPKTFYCIEIDSVLTNTLRFRSSTPGETLSYYYAKDSMVYYQHISFSYPYEHGYFEVTMHTP